MTEFAKELARAAKELRMPAGSDPRFSTEAGIKANKRDFVTATHKTLRYWHRRGIQELLLLDGFGRAEQANPIGPVAEEWLQYSRALWRRVSDAVVWVMCGGYRHKVKRLCFYRQRNFIDESNPEAALKVLDELNSDPMVLAIWNDATSCVDVGDITVGRPLETADLQFLELKSGEVNRAVLDVLALDENERSNGLARLEEQFGSKARKQFERAARQERRNQQATTLLTQERGLDPVTGLDLEVMEIPDPENFWFSELEATLVRAVSTSGTAECVIDGCLHIYADASPRTHWLDAQHQFVQRMTQAEPRITGEKRRNDLGRIVSLHEGLFEPVTLPLFIAPIEPSLVGEVLYGALLRKVFLSLDWQVFAQLIEERGGRLEWTGRKERDQRLSLPWDLRSFAVFGEVPKVVFDDVTLYPTGANLRQVFFDGLSPRNLARNFEEMARLLRERRSVGRETE